MNDKPQIVNLKNLLRLPEFDGVIESDGRVGLYLAPKYSIGYQWLWMRSIVINLNIYTV